MDNDRQQPQKSGLTQAISNMMWRLNWSNSAIWNQAGLMICRKGEVVSFGDLNPEVQFQYRLDRWDRVKLGFWFLWAAVRKEAKDG